MQRIFLRSTWKTITKMMKVSANMSTQNLISTRFLKVNKRGTIKKYNKRENKLQIVNVNFTLLIIKLNRKLKNSN